MTTLRPFGPSVAFTAAAMMLTPLSSAARASSSNLSCFGMGRVPPSYSRMARTSSSRIIRYSLSSIFTSEPEYFPNRILSPAFTSSGIFLPSSVTLPLPTAITLPSWGFSLAVSGMMIPPFLTSFSSSRSTRSRSCNGRIFIRSSSCGELHGGVRITFLGLRPDLPLGHEHHDRPGEGDVSRREEPPAHSDAQGPEDPAHHDAPDYAEHQIPDQPVPSILHHDPGQRAGQQPHDHPRAEHAELHDPSSFSGGGSVGHRLRFTIPLDLGRVSLYKLYINYKSYDVVRPGSRAAREVGGRRAVTPFRRCSMRNVTHALVGAIVASLVAAAVSVYAQTPTAADFAVCNADAQVAVKAGTAATPTTKDYMRVESARTDSAATTWTTWVGPIRMESSDPQLTGMANDGITDAAYQATYRTCMRRNGF